MKLQYLFIERRHVSEELMELSIETIITELGYGLGAAILLYFLYARFTRTNEQNLELQTTLSDSLAMIHNHASSLSDLKSATTRAAEMDRLYQVNHQMMMDGHATIVNQIPSAVEELAETQSNLTSGVTGLIDGLNAFATTSTGGQEELRREIIDLRSGSQETSAQQAESTIQLTSRVEHLTAQVEQISRAMTLMLQSSEVHQASISKSIETIERKIQEEF